MTKRSEPNKWAGLDFPPQFRVGIERFALDAGWRVKVREGATYVAAEERYTNTRPQLLRLVKIADAHSANNPSVYERFNSWHKQDQYGSEDLRARVAQLREIQDPQDNADAWVSFRLQFMAMPDADVAPFLRGQFPTIIATFPDASLWGIEIHPQFRWRVAAVRALFAARETPEVLVRPESDKRTRFFSSQGLGQAWNLGQSAFIDPSLLAASPWVTGLSSYRAGGTAVMLLGKPAPGFTGRQAVEVLDVFRVGALAKSRVGIQMPEYASRSYEDALVWWVNKLNDLVGMALDIGRFTDEAGVYQPAAHFGVLLSLERLFASAQTILTEARGSELVRLVMFFDVIDLFDGLSFGSWESLLTRPRVERDLADLESLLPVAARGYLLTRCHPAIEALRALEDGFVLKERIVDGKLRVRQKDGKGWQDLALTNAVPQYLRVARNSTHSFRKMAKDPHEVSLLAAHDGEIQDALSDLSFLHLLRFLANPHLPNS